MKQKEGRKAQKGSKLWQPPPSSVHVSSEKERIWFPSQKSVNAWEK